MESLCTSLILSVGEVYILCMTGLSVDMLYFNMKMFYHTSQMLIAS